MNSTLRATLTLSGTIIGLGAFAIPWAFSKAGFAAGTLELFLLSALVVLFHLMYGEIVLRTPGVKTRFPGYIKLYLGARAARLALAILLISLWGVLLVYIVVGGSFLAHLHKLFLGNEHIGPLIFFLVGLGGVALGLRGVSELESWFTIILVVTVLLLTAVLLQRFDSINLSLYNPRFLFVPYGILLFALDGMAAIPGLEEILGTGRRNLLRRVIIIGTLLPALLYFLFAFSVVGALGGSVSKDGLSGLSTILPPYALWLAYAFGFLAILTTFWTVGVYIWEAFANDLAVPRWPAFLAVFLPPAFLYVVGLRDFVSIISFIGAIFFPLNAIMLLFAHKRSKKLGQDVSSYSVPNSRFLRSLFITVFVAAIIYEIWRFFIAV